MKHLNTTLTFFVLIFLLNSCQRQYDNTEFALKEIGLKITLPANAIIQYDAPSYEGDISRYDLSYNDGNSSNPNVSISFEKTNKDCPNSLSSLQASIEEVGGVILERFSYSNGFIGCSYEYDGNKLYKFIKMNIGKDALVVTPDEYYNNKLKYFSVLLKAIESIEFMGV